MGIKKRTRRKQVGSRGGDGSGERVIRKRDTVSLRKDTGII